jgi:hypothetical protein
MKFNADPDAEEQETQLHSGAERLGILSHAQDQSAVPEGFEGEVDFSPAEFQWDLYHFRRTASHLRQWFALLPCERVSRHTLAYDDGVQQIFCDMITEFHVDIWTMSPNGEPICLL